MAVLSFSCPHCGAPIENLKEGHAFHCPYCTSDFSFEEMQTNAKKEQEKIESEIERQHKQEIESEKYKDEVVTYECKQCGAQVVSDKNTVATFCLYCHSSNVIPSRLVHSYAPDKIIPFTINEEKAKEEFQKWSGSIAFLPDSFTDEKHLEKISPLYAPFWLYTIHSQFHVEGKGIRQKTWQTGNYRFTKRDHYDIKKLGNIKYSRIAVDASTALDNKAMQLLEPYDYKQIVDFDMAHLAGHYAEKFDDSKEELTKEVVGDVEQNMKTQMSGMKSSFHSFTSAIENAQIKTNDTEYAFIPLWFLNYRYEDQNYAFTMNGQTGKVVGMLPIDKQKQKRYWLTMSIILFIIFSIVNAFLVVRL